jgi:SAM-dependent methyltransferase
MPSHRSRPIGNGDTSGHRILASRSTIRQADSRDRPEPRTGGMGSVPSISDHGRSRNVRTQFTPDDARRFYDRFGSRQDTQGFYENPALDDLVKYADFEHARSVLEFGCGTGSFARRLLETDLPVKAHYLGLDISGTMIGLAKSRLGPWQGRAEVHQTDSTPGLAVPDASFDRFLVTYVIDLLDPTYSGHLIAEANRVLIPSGLLCTVNLTHGTGAFSRFASRLWTSICDRWPRLVGGCRPIRLAERLEPERWRIRHHWAVVSFGSRSQC